jgi:predicted RNase H-like HicB family nuclease
MKEILFLVEESQDGGYYAKAANTSIITQGDTVAELKQNISDAVRCHFEEDEMPRIIRLHITREDTIVI